MVIDSDGSYHCLALLIITGQCFNPVVFDAMAAGKGGKDHLVLRDSFIRDEPLDCSSAYVTSMSSMPGDPRRKTRTPGDSSIDSQQRESVSGLKTI